MTVQPLPKDEDFFSAVRASTNRGLMVQWINADLFSRAGHDVRKSIVFYDDARTFEAALTAEDWQALADAGKREVFLEKLAAATPIRYWSKGVK